jgi:CBS domain containing-hemolysin-like protein
MAGKAARVGKAALRPQDVDEDTIAAFIMKTVDRRPEDTVVVHAVPFARRPLSLLASDFHCERLARV